MIVKEWCETEPTVKCEKSVISVTMTIRRFKVEEEVHAVVWFFFVDFFEGAKIC